VRLSGAFFITILIAVGYMLYLTARDATSSLDAIAVVSTDLREQGIEGAELDREPPPRRPGPTPRRRRAPSCAPLSRCVAQPAS
jgi:hypothetical protein